MNLLASDTTFGRAARLPLRLLSPEKEMRILAPRELRGARWLVSAGLHSCWLGTYEREKRGYFAAAVKPGSVVFDVGAQAGFYTLLASRLAGPTGTVLAIEPLPRNLGHLREHVARNGAANVTIVPAAAADRPGTAAFRTEETGYMGRLAPDGELSVPVLTLDDLAATHAVRPDVVKLDVEGGEAEVLHGAHRILTEDRPVVFLATHGQEPHARSCAALNDLDYRLIPLDAPTLDEAREILARPGGV